MDKSKKLYMKAIEYYNDGYIDKAMEACEKSISENINNTSAVNLKGLLYYIKGELEGAQALWKMNYQMNKDLVSKKYLEDSRNDEEKKALYKAALSALKEIRIKQALELLKTCKKSDFNCINVNNYITLCFIKLGEYSKAEETIEEVLKIDKTNKDALNHRRELVKFGVVKKGRSTVKYILLVVIIAVLSSLLVFFKGNVSKKRAGNNEELKPPIEQKANDSKQIVDGAEGAHGGSKENTSKPEGQISDNFPREELQKALKETNYEIMYNTTAGWRNKVHNEEDGGLIAGAIEQLEQKGLEYFYNKGREAYSSKDYNKAVEYFSKAYDHGDKSYLYSHIIYMLGASYQSAGDVKSTIKYYSEYDTNYPNGDYEQTILYELTLIYKNIDNKKCKSYAERLVKLYPKSIYNNSTIKAIIVR